MQVSILVKATDDYLFDSVLFHVKDNRILRDLTSLLAYMSHTFLVNFQNKE